MTTALATTTSLHDRECTEAAELQRALEAAGFNAIYGGGTDGVSNSWHPKGHGFWIRRSAAPEEPFLNNGIESGNPAFWLVADIKSLLALLRAVPVS